MLDCEFVSCPHLRHDSSPSRRLIKTANGRRGSFRFKIEMLGHAQPSSRLIVTHLAEVKVGRLFSLAKAYSIARSGRGSTPCTLLSLIAKATTLRPIWSRCVPGLIG